MKKYNDDDIAAFKRIIEGGSYSEEFSRIDFKRYCRRFDRWHMFVFPGDQWLSDMTLTQIRQHKDFVLVVVDGYQAAATEAEKAFKETYRKLVDS